MTRRFVLDRLLAGCLLGVIVAGAAYLRFSGADWDRGYQLHPDERAILFVAQDIHLPHSLNEAFSARHSPLDPYRNADGSERLFAYGSLPLYVEVAAQRLIAGVCHWSSTCNLIPPGTFAGRLVGAADKADFDQLTFVGRAVSALFDTLTVLIAYFLAQELFESRAAGLAASALLAGAVIHIQNAHFGTVDSPLAFFCTSSLWLTIRYARSGRRADSILAGLAAGLAIGCKASGLLLAIPLLTAYVQPRREVRSIRDIHIPGVRAPRVLAWTAAAMLLAFVVTNPYGVLDWGGFVDSLGPQLSLAVGTGQPPFVLQYAGTWPVAYGLDQLDRWAFGPLLALATYAGLAWGVWQAITRRSRPMLVIVTWAVAAVVVLSSGSARFPRYLLPATPTLLVLAAGFLTIPRRVAAGWKAVAVGIVLAATAANAAAFVQMYAAPHPWVAASRWMYENIPAGSRLIDEMNDDALPIDLAGADGYHVRDLTYQATRIDPLAEPDDCAKIEGIAESLSNSDYLVLASSRMYGVIPRLKERFPFTASYYANLMSGTLGFELTHTWSRYPNLAGWSLVDNPFDELRQPALPDFPPKHIDIGHIDESFSVYDHPLVLLFRNQAKLPAERILRVIVGAAACQN